MACIYINLHKDGGEPEAYYLTLDTGESFITVRPGSDCTLALCGYDHAAVASAVALADAIRDAAESLKARLPMQQAPVPESDPQPEEVAL